MHKNNEEAIIFCKKVVNTFFAYLYINLVNYYPSCFKSVQTLSSVTCSFTEYTYISLLLMMSHSVTFDTVSVGKIFITFLCICFLIKSLVIVLI